jgi:ribosomal subunit interface protein
MDIAVVGRNTEVPERFRKHLEEKLSKVEQLAPRAQRVEVELTHERNPRLADRSERVELTVLDRGPTVRAEASAGDRYAALDLAAAKLLERLRRARDRRKNHHGRRDMTPVDVPAAPEPVLEVLEDEPPTELAPPLEPGVAVEAQLGDSPVIVRQKLHEASPMTVDQALYQMELVGHPFYLFIDEDTGQPCAVYHRHGWTYGVIRLNTVVADHAGTGADAELSAAPSA